MIYTLSRSMLYSATHWAEHKELRPLQVNPGVMPAGARPGMVGEPHFSRSFYRPDRRVVSQESRSRRHVPGWDQDPDTHAITNHALFGRFEDLPTLKRLV